MSFAVPEWKISMLQKAVDVLAHKNVGKNKGKLKLVLVKCELLC